MNDKNRYRAVDQRDHVSMLFQSVLFCEPSEIGWSVIRGKTKIYK